MLINFDKAKGKQLQLNGVVYMCISYVVRCEFGNLPSRIRARMADFCVPCPRTFAEDPANEPQYQKDASRQLRGQSEVMGAPVFVSGHQEILNRASALPVPRPAKDDLLTRVKTAVKEGEGFKDWKVLLHAVRAFSTKRTESCLQNYVRADCKLDIASDRRLIFLHEGAKKDCIAEFADLYNIVTHEDIQRICQCKPIYLEELRTATQQTVRHRAHCF